MCETSVATILESAFLAKLISLHPVFRPYGLGQNTFKNYSTINCAIHSRHCVKNFLFISSVFAEVPEACRCDYSDFTDEETEF